MTRWHAFANRVELPSPTLHEFLHFAHVAELTASFMLQSPVTRNSIGLGETPKCANYIRAPPLLSLPDITTPNARFLRCDVHNILGSHSLLSLVSRSLSVRALVARLNG